jgi:hypothetical protein
MVVMMMVVVVAVVRRCNGGTSQHQHSYRNRNKLTHTR